MLRLIRRQTPFCLIMEQGPDSENTDMPGTIQLEVKPCDEEAVKPAAQPVVSRQKKWCMLAVQRRS